MKLKATDEQMKQMAANAVNASKPMGMGHFHFKADSVWKPEDLRLVEPVTGIHLDYVQGRMVKFNAWKKDGIWELRDGDTDPEYQSWSYKYPTWRALAESVGASVVP